MKKKAPALDQVQQAVLPHLNSAHVEGERWRAEELEVRRGLRAEFDEMGSAVRSTAQPHGLWHAMDHHPGTV